MQRQKFILTVNFFAFLLYAFNQNKETAIGQVKNSLKQKANIQNAKEIGTNIFNQQSIILTIKSGSIIEKPLDTAAADSAFKIASAVFSSMEFQQGINVLSFKRSSYCRNRTSCTKNEKDNGERIPGSIVLSDLFKERNVVLFFRLMQKGHALGNTCLGEYDMTAYYDNIMWDMRKDSMPPAYKIAVNVCHEYMHQIGYCHIYGKLNEVDEEPDKRYIDEDVTYRIGWNAYYVLKAWYARKEIIKGL